MSVYILEFGSVGFGFTALADVHAGKSVELSAGVA
jgi:hypothetical protein